MFLDYLEEKNLNRLALVGTNSQGKSYMISKDVKGDIAKKTILVTNEVKADENLKNSTDTSTLIVWLNSLLDKTKAKEAIQEQIDGVDLSSINSNSFLNISLNNNLESYKGIISADIKTNSNIWGKPGSGERFLGQLLLISKILEDNPNENYKYLVIDEPEQHLHPSLYIKVGKILNKISHQGIKVIIATHSPVITQNFVEDTEEIAKVINGDFNPLPSTQNLMQFNLKYDCYTKEELKNSSYKKIEDKYETYFNNFVLPIIIKALFCDYMLLGEGAIESKIFDLYIMKYGSLMEKNNIEYSIGDGKIFFPLILSILKEIGIRTVSLYDLDDENNDMHKYLNTTIESLSDKTIPFKPNIETRLKITKDMYKDKYRGSIILMNDLYIDENKELMDLLDEINAKLDALK